MSDLADGSPLAQLIRAAFDEPALRFRLYYCPERVIQGLQLSADERHAIRTGDFSRVALDPETLRLGRRLYSELPESGSAPPADGSLGIQPSRLRELCT